MIAEFIINIVFGIVEGALSILPEFSWGVENAFFSSALDLVRVAGYVLPMGTIVSIIAIIHALLCFRIVISILRTIWEVLPLV